MRKVTNEQVYKDIQPKQVWKVWTDVNNWHQWDHDIEFAKMEQAFEAGSSFKLKPKKGPLVKIQLLRVEENRGYTDVTTFPLAKMYGVHDMELTKQGLKLTTSIEVVGILSWLWWKIVGQGVAAGLKEQDDTLIEVARKKQ